MENFNVVDGKVQCVCGHWIGIIGTKWQHIDEKIIAEWDDIERKQIKYRETCYHCSCINPVPASKE